MLKSNQIMNKMITSHLTSLNTQLVPIIIQYFQSVLTMMSILSFYFFFKFLYILLKPRRPDKELKI